LVLSCGSPRTIWEHRQRAVGKLFFAPAHGASNACQRPLIGVQPPSGSFGVNFMLFEYALTRGKFRVVGGDRDVFSLKVG